MKSSPARILISLLLAALALRLYRLNDGLWVDEIITWYTYMRLPLPEIPSAYFSENQHFFYSLLAKCSMLLLGESVWAFRLPAALFGAGSIWAMYLFASESASEKEGLWSAALLTFSYHHIWYSQTARGYTVLLFWVLLASWLLVRAVREQRLTLWIAYAVAAALGAYTHPSMAFLLIAQAGVACWYMIRHKSYGGVIGFGLCGLLTILFYLPALPAMLQVPHDTGSSINAWKQVIMNLFREAASGGKLGLTVLAAVPAVVLAAAGLYSFLRSNPVVVVLLLGPPAIGVATLLLLNHHIYPRFFFIVFGFGLMIVVRGLLQLKRAATPLLCLFLLGSLILIPRVYGPKQDFESAKNFVDTDRRPGDAVAITQVTARVYRNFYSVDWNEVDSDKKLRDLANRSERTWFLYTIPEFLVSNQPEMYATIKRKFRKVRVFPGTLNHGEIVVCLYERKRGEL